MKEAYSPTLNIMVFEILRKQPIKIGVKKTNTSSLQGHMIISCKIIGY